MIEFDFTEFVDKGMKDLAKKWEDYYYSGVVTPPLAPSTVASKIAKGSSYPDTPLIDTELAVSSIESGVNRLGDTHYQGYVGIFTPARADIMTYHEYGLGVPERPTLRPVFDENIDRIVDDIYDDIFEEIKRKFYEE